MTEERFAKLYAAAHNAFHAKATINLRVRMKAKKELRQAIDLICIEATPTQLERFRQLQQQHYPATISGSTDSC